MFGISSALFWLFVAIFFALVEAVTVGITSIWFAVGALSAMVVALVLTDWIILQIVVFLGVTAFMLLKTRKIAVEKLKIGAQKTDRDLLVGAEAIVTAQIRPHDYGEVKVSGRPWRAKSESNRQYEPGDVVTVLRIEGVTLYLE